MWRAGFIASLHAGPSIAALVILPSARSFLPKPDTPAPGVILKTRPSMSHQVAVLEITARKEDAPSSIQGHPNASALKADDDTAHAVPHAKQAVVAKRHHPVTHRRLAGR